LQNSGGAMARKKKEGQLLEGFRRGFRRGFRLNS